MIDALVSGEAATVSNALVRAGFNPGSRTMRNRLGPDGDLRIELERQLNAAGLSQDAVIKKLASKMDAKRVVTVNRKAITVEDNDAQLRAVDIAIKLHDRTGKLPAAQESGSTGTQITVNILKFSNLKTPVINKIDNEPK